MLEELLKRFRLLQELELARLDIADIEAGKDAYSWEDYVEKYEKILSKDKELKKIQEEFEVVCKYLDVLEYDYSEMLVDFPVGECIY